MKRYLKFLGPILFLCGYSYLLTSYLIHTIKAMGKIKFNDSITGYLISIEGSPTCDETGMFFYCFDHSKKLCNKIKLNGGYGVEGGEGMTDSWILDYNGDGIADILQIYHHTSYLGQDAEVINSTEYHLFLLETNSFKEIILEDIDSLKVKFKIQD